MTVQAANGLAVAGSPGIAELRASVDGIAAGAGAQGRADARYVDWQNVCQLHCSNVTRSTGAAEHAAIRPL